MLGLSRAAIAAVLICACMASAAEFDRPQNGDCLNLPAGTADVQLYPEQFLMVGDGQVKDPFFTQARAPRAPAAWVWATRVLPPSRRQLAAAAAHLGCL